MNTSYVVCVTIYLYVDISNIKILVKYKTSNIELLYKFIQHPYI